MKNQPPYGKVNVKHLFSARCGNSRRDVRRVREDLSSEAMIPIGECNDS